MIRTAATGLTLILLAWMVSCSKGKTDPYDPVPDTTSGNLPVLRGKLVFHAYTCYECNDSRIYLYDFAASKLTCLSCGWNIKNPMNAHFSPGGNKITFMGMPYGTSDWDVFIYDIPGASAPVDLTAGVTARDEDPKFSPDGSRIVFKRNGRLVEMDTNGILLRSFEVPQTEASMPYYTSAGDGILYSGSDQGNGAAAIFLYSVSDSSVRALYRETEIVAYYPVARDDTSYLFTRWVSNTNLNDQVYLGFYDARSPRRLPFNDTGNNYSDAFPAGSRLVILSGTRPGGQGQYDLYVADMISGKIWSLTKYNSGINSEKNELGACYLGP